MHRGGLPDLSPLADREFRGAAADIHVEDGGIGRLGEFDGARPMRGQKAFQIRPCRGADEPPAFLAEQLTDGARILPQRRLAGRDHRAAVDVIRREPGGAIRFRDKPTQRRRVDLPGGSEWSEDDRRAIENLACCHDVAARQPLALPLQHQPREDEVRGRRANVDADALELDAFADVGKGAVVEVNVVFVAFVQGLHLHFVIASPEGAWRSHIERGGRHGPYGASRWLRHFVAALLAMTDGTNSSIFTWTPFALQRSTKRRWIRGS